MGGGWKRDKPEPPPKVPGEETKQEPYYDIIQFKMGNPKFDVYYR
jgi:hypothetical protein